MSIEEQFERLRSTPPDALRALVLDDRMHDLVRACAVSLLPPEALDGVIHDIMTTGRSYSLVDEAALQRPTALTPHLAYLWAMRVDNDLDIEPRWWRGADATEIDRLAAALRTPGRGYAHELAGRCLAESRQPAAWAALADSAEPEVDAWLAAAGARRDGDGVRSLVPPACYHLLFEAPAQARPRAPWLTRWHPTWAAGADPGLPTVTHGGLSDAICRLCAAPMRRLLLLDPVPAGLGVTSRARVDIAYCRACTGSERSAYRHDDAGRPTLVSNPTDAVAFQSKEERPAVTVRLAALGPRWAVQDWGLANDTQNLNRLGGEPTWIERPDYAPCPTCGRLTTALAQLDWGCLEDTGGLTYVGWCDPCATSTLTHQHPYR
ncbi:hypothetical protein ACFQX7_08315 [Luedemannella flava]|uniref:hypothetical protein n=1 Tax=Luedemannella flava TaxID=349316 RepID=UPI0031CDEA40